MPRQLPDRPRLEQLKKQAKALLHAVQKFADRKSQGDD